MGGSVIRGSTVYAIRIYDNSEPSKKYFTKKHVLSSLLNMQSPAFNFIKNLGHS